jgi:N-acetylmuramoyl-L-alanine amidase
VSHETGIGKFVAPSPLASRFLLANIFSWTVILTLALTLLMAVDAWATIIEEVSLHRLDNVVEVEFRMKGEAPRWRLEGHGQELWIDLEDSRLAGSVASVPTQMVFPIARISMHDFGGGRVRLVIRVRGEIDYAVAQMPQLLIARIARSGQATDLAQPLLSEVEQNSRESVGGASISGDQTRPITPRPHNSSTERVELANLPIGLASPRSRPTSATSRIESSGVSNVHNRQSVYGDQATARTVQPIANHVATNQGVEPDRTPPTVVIDAGHGGIDPGTESASGIPEKTVALAIAQRLVVALEARGIKVELTRDDDRFLRLGERTEIANHAHAALFVSIHLNSSPDWNTSGIETYYLNNTTDRATIRLARIENSEDTGAQLLSNLNYILVNLRQDYKAHESSSLARMIEVEAAASIDSMLGIRVNALGAKMGPFYVLVGAEMPSVLIECGFLSNPREAQFLIQPRYQEALADGIAGAIMHYFEADAAVGNL